MAIITDPKIVHSCCVSTAASSILEKKYFLSVPYSDKYLQAYVQDESLLNDVLCILKKLDPMFIEDKETLVGRGKKEVDVKNKNEKENENKKENKKEKEKEKEKERESDFNNDFKWYRNLENWSYI